MAFPAGKRLRTEADGAPHGRSLSFAGRMRALSELVLQGRIDKTDKLHLADAILGQDPTVAAALSHFEATGEPSLLKAAAVAKRAISSTSGGVDISSSAHVGALSLHNPSSTAASGNGSVSGTVSSLHSRFANAIAADVPAEQPVAGLDSVLAQSLLSSFPASVRESVFSRNDTALNGAARDGMSAGMSTAAAGHPVRQHIDSSDEEGDAIGSTLPSSRQPIARPPTGRAPALSGSSGARAGSFSGQMDMDRLKALRSSFDHHLGLPHGALAAGKRPRGPSSHLYMGAGPGVGMGPMAAPGSFDLTGGGPTGAGSDFGSVGGGISFDLNGGNRKSSLVGLMSSGAHAGHRASMGSPLLMGWGAAHVQHHAHASAPRQRMPSDLGEALGEGIGMAMGLNNMGTAPPFAHAPLSAPPAAAGRWPVERPGVIDSPAIGGMHGESDDEDRVLGLAGKGRGGMPGASAMSVPDRRSSGRLASRREPALTVPPAPAKAAMAEDIWEDGQGEEAHGGHSGAGQPSLRPVHEAGYDDDGEADGAYGPDQDGQQVVQDFEAGEEEEQHLRSKSTRQKGRLKAQAVPASSIERQYRTGGVAPPTVAPSASDLPDSAPGMDTAVSMYAAYRGSDVLRSRAGAAQVPYGAGGTYAAAKDKAAMARGGPIAPVRERSRERPGKPSGEARRISRKAEEDAYAASLGMAPMDDQGEDDGDLEDEEDGDGYGGGMGAGDDSDDMQEEFGASTGGFDASRHHSATAAPERPAPGSAGGGSSGPSKKPFVPLPGAGAGPGPGGYDPAEPVFPDVFESVTVTGIELPVVPRERGWIGAYPPDKRAARVARFLHRRANHRVWEKTVKYDVRKSFADSRLRVKGRFVKKEDEALLRDFMQLV